MNKILYIPHIAQHAPGGVMARQGGPSYSERLGHSTPEHTELLSRPTTRCPAALQRPL